MSYQVLARKWRPTNFKQMVGQEHVLQALVHALESQRLHHAYLFTGTRGVGKTTIARILARCLSCDSGITAEPCGTCGACSSIEQGRYVDLIEIDAASRTKVEDMRELLENVQYAPTEGRFKIYLIDEVHMLSAHSFNALLKTLEEPPEHVKFLFATTDPQKLPITILSRCLQFNLKNMTPEKIVHHLQYVLSEEKVNAEDAALWSISRAADGSMRDALSLTDQAIAYTQGDLKETAVSAMLGTVDQKKVYRLLDALVSRDPKSLLHVVAELAEFSPDYASVLGLIISVMHRVALEQAVQGVTDNSQGDQEKITFYAQNLSGEDVQLYYQIALVARKDLAITPDARAGFEMALLRMIAFQMAPMAEAPTEHLGPEVSAEHAHARREQSVAESQVAQEVSQDQPQDNASETSSQYEEPPLQEPPAYLSEVDAEMSAQPISEAQKKTPEITEETLDASPKSELTPEPEQASMPVQGISPSQAEVIEPASAIAHKSAEGAVVASQLAQSAPQITPSNEDSTSDTPEAIETLDWSRQSLRLGLTGMTQNLLLNMVKDQQGDQLRMYVESGHFRLLNDSHKRKIVQALNTVLGWTGPVEFVDGVDDRHETPAMWRERMKLERLQEAKLSLQADPNVQKLIAEFDGRMLEDSVVALGPIQ